MTRSPFVGLRPYSDREASIFFGRERERRIVASNLLASRLTLLYGPSGVGKSSILNAGVVPHLRSLARKDADEEGPAYAVVVFNAWRDEPVGALVSCVAAASPWDGKAAPLDTATPLAEALRAWTAWSGEDLLLVLDQFEEYFLYHGASAGQDRFAQEFPDAVNDPTLRVNFLLSLREDALANLDLFKGRIPRLFGNYLRIGYVDATGARGAIEGPIGEHNRSNPNAPVEIEPALVDAVLEQVQTGRVVVGQAGAGTVEASVHASAPMGIETSHLQIVMTRLWSEELANGSHVLRAATLDRLGGAAEIVHSHLDRELDRLSDDEQDVAAAVFEHLVTPSGTKIAHSAGDLAVLAGVPAAEVSTVLERLSAGDSRVLRPVEPAPGRRDERYEIFHDVLAPAILDWRARYVQRQEKAAAEEELRRQRQLAEERARAARRRARNISIFSLVTALLVVAVALALAAQQQRELARSRQQAADARAYLSIDPVRSVRAALDALDTAHTPEAEGALREAVAGVRVRSVLTGHSDWIQTVAFDPAGQRLVTASDDETARVWDLATGEQRIHLHGHTNWVARAAFDPAGTTVLTASADGTARLWDAATGRGLRILAPAEEERSPLVTAQFDPSGRSVVTAGSDGAVRLWEAGSGRQLHELRGHAGVVTSARFDTTGQRLVTAGSDGTVRVWDTGGGQELARLDRHKGRVASAVFSPDGQLVASAGTDRTASVWRWQGGDALALVGHSAELDAVEFDSTGSRVVTAGDTVARVWDTGSGQMLARLRGHAGHLTSALFTGDGRRVVTASQDGSARVWDVATESTVVALRGHSEIIWNVAVNPANDRMLATAGSDGTARVWELPEQLTLVHSAPVDTAAFSPDGRAAITSDSGNARIWNTRSGAPEAVLPGHAGPTWVGFSPDGQLVVTADDERVRVWERRAPDRPVAETTEVRGGPARFLPDGRSLIVTAPDWTLYRWDWTTPGPLQRLTGYRGAIQLMDLELSADGTRGLTAWSDRVARIWDLHSGNEVVTMRGHDGVIYSARYSADGKRVVTSSADGTVRIWNADTGRQVRSLEADRGLRAAAFDPSGQRVLAGSDDGRVHIWDADTGHMLSVLSRHSTTVTAAEFSPDGRSILSASADWTAAIYTCPTCGDLSEVRAQGEAIVDRIPDVTDQMVSGWALVPGDCYDPAGAYARITDCDGLHEREVFAVLEHPAGYDAPFDERELDSYARAHCEGTPFRAYVGRSAVGSRYEVTYWTPTPTSWEAGDRRITCVLSTKGGSRESARGTER